MCRSYQTAILSLVGCLLGVSAHAQPAISSINPPSLPPGQTTEVELRGSKLNGPVRIWTSFPAETEIVDMPPSEGEVKILRCRFTLGGNVELGTGGVVVANASGVSDFFLVPVDSLNNCQDNGKNQSQETAQAISLPTAVNGSADNSRIDYYRFDAVAGQLVSFDVLCARIGSTMDPVIQVLKANGQIVKMADDDPGLGADCRTTWRCPATGTYYVAIHDNRYLGGQKYRLRIGDFPLVTTTYPLGTRIGQKTDVGFVGPTAEPISARTVLLPLSHIPRLLQVTALHPNGAVGAPALMLASQLQEHVESEPNNQPGQAKRISIPSAINGRLQTLGDRDFFEIAAQKGQRIHVRPVSRSVGLPTIVAAKCVDLNGKVIVENKLVQDGESSFEFTAPDTTSYRLQVEDLLRRGGPDHAYRLEVTTGPAISLNVKFDPKKPNYRFLTPLSRGAFAFDIECVRHGYEGPIELDFQSPWPGAKLINRVIPAKAKEVRLVVIAPPNSELGQLQTLRFVGVAKELPDAPQVPVSTHGLQKARYRSMPILPGWADGLLLTSTTTAQAPFFELKMMAEQIEFPNIVRNATFDIHLQRKHKDFKEGLILAIEGLPDSVHHQVKADKDTYKVSLSADRDIQDIRQPIRIVAFSRHQGRGQIVSSPPIPLQVLTPLNVEVEPAGPLTVGASQKLRIRVTRRGQISGPVTVRWPQLPSGISGDKVMSLAADQTEITVELRAATDAPAGKFDKLVAEATFNYGDKAWTTKSEPVTLEVQPR